MKKQLCLLAMLLLTACGGGSTSSTSDGNAPAGLSNLAVKIVPPSDSTGKPVAADSIPKMYRVVVRNVGRQINVIRDEQAGQQITFSLPVSGGYSVEAIAYTIDPQTGLNRILHYAVANNVRVDSSGNSTTPTMYLHPVTVRLLLPNPILQGGSYGVMANYSSGGGRYVTPLNTLWHLSTPKTSTFAPFVNVTSATVFSNPHPFGVPTTYGVPTNLYFQAVFTLKPTLLNPGESPKKWFFNADEVVKAIGGIDNVKIDLPDFPVP